MQGQLLVKQLYCNIFWISGCLKGVKIRFLSSAEKKTALFFRQNSFQAA